MKIKEKNNLEKKGNKKRFVKFICIFLLISCSFALIFYFLNNRSVEDNIKDCNGDNCGLNENINIKDNNITEKKKDRGTTWKPDSSSGSSIIDEDIDLIDSEYFDEVYSYSDEDSEGGFYINDSNDEIEVSRAYVWKSQFGAIFIGKIKIVSSSEDYDWYGSRLAIINPENIFERYELRLLPNEQKIEVKYVDRTNRNSSAGTDDSKVNENTISESLNFESCEIELGEWYYISVFRNGDKFKAQIVRFNKPTCFLEWEDDRINGEELAIGIQSAGKYVVSRFDRIFTN